MRLRRKPAEPVRRQRLPSQDLETKPSTFTYRSRRSDGLKTGRQNSPESGPIVARSTNYWAQRLGLVLLLVALLFSAVNVFSLSSKAKVMPLISGQNKAFLRETTVYEQAANEVLASSVWNRNKITVDTGSVSRELTRRFPELATASVTVPLLSHRPLVYIEPAEPALILMARNGAFVVADSGKALLQADNPEALNQPDLPKVNDQSGLRVELTRQALPADDVSFIKTVIAQLRDKQLTIESLSLPTAARQLDVKLAGEPYVIKFNLMATGEARQQAGAFLATHERLQQQNIKPAEYVDVRVSGRAYYK